MKQNKITRQELAPPYRPQDLLSVRNFINFCEQNGVKVNKKDLEFYDKQNVIIPALRVKYGYVAYRKIFASFTKGNAPEWGFVYEGEENKFDYTDIDKHVYYNYGGIFRQGNGWLKYYEENDLIEVPAAKEFKPWDQYTLKEHFSSNKKHFTDAAQTYYSPYQIYPLGLTIQAHRTTIDNEMLLAEPEKWKKLGEQVNRLRWFNDFKADRQSAIRHYKFHCLLIKIEDLHDAYQADVDKFYTKLIKENSQSDAKSARREALKDLKASYNTLNNPFKNKARKLLHESGYSESDIANELNLYIRQGSFERTQLDSRIKAAA